ncbi:hypothetical protein HN358_00605 [Candidatus Uhrbacteria bacterium]|jgi:hypothetical protein|nr:hypothetical protein [Candidatus Uhrbacteria bacterium]MBT7717385.1 hypothetical protein [Candidatus Uhrbacteria bacterium]
MVDVMKPSPKAKKRNIGLTVWLVIMIIFAAWAALANFGMLFSDVYFSMPNWIVFTMGLLAVANLIFVLYIWQWKMWAFQGFVATTVIAFILNLIGGVSFISAGFGFIGVIILYLFMRPQWKWFE